MDDEWNDRVTEPPKFNFAPPKTVECSKCKKETVPALAVAGTTKLFRICADCLINVLETR